MTFWQFFFAMFLADVAVIVVLRIWDAWTKRVERQSREYHRRLDETVDRMARLFEQIENLDKRVRSEQPGESA